MTKNNLQRQVFTRPSPDPDPDNSETHTSVQAQQDSSSQRTFSAAAPSTRCMTPDLSSSARRGTPSVAGSSSNSSQQERPPQEDILRDLINPVVSEIRTGNKRPRDYESEPEEEPSPKRDRHGRDLDRLGEELDELDRIAREAALERSAKAAQTPEPKDQTALVTPPQTHRVPGDHRSIPFRGLQRSPSHQAGTDTLDDTAIEEGSSSGEETYKPPHDAN